METQIKVKLKPFSVPNYVIIEPKPRPKEDGYTDSPNLRLADLDSETLQRLCDNFSMEVFKKAGKMPPKQNVFKHI